MPTFSIQEQRFRHKDNQDAFWQDVAEIEAVSHDAAAVLFAESKGFTRRDTLFLVGNIFDLSGKRYQVTPS